jgi:N-acetylmuramoyl-L-alanine amidase
MRIAPAVFCLMLCLTSSAPAALRHFERVLVSGSEYVRLSAWCEASGLALQWNKKERQIEVSGAPARLALEVNSRKAEIDGVAVLLSLPVVKRSGAVLVSLPDLRTTLEPILFPRKSEKRLKTICLDPGHGGKDTGKAVGGNYEKKYTFLLARATAELLEHEGFKVVLTRDGDEAVELSERPQRAAREGADLFVSLHYNAGDSDVRGLEVFCLTPAGLGSSNEGGGPSDQTTEAGNQQDDRNALLAYQLQKSVTRGAALFDRGMKRARFEVLREARLPAVLIEGGFLSNPSDAKNIYDGAFRQRMAHAIVAGILAYQKAVGGPVAATVVK